MEPKTETAVLRPSKPQLRAEMLLTLYLARHEKGGPKFGMRDYAKLENVIMCREPLTW